MQAVLPLRLSSRSGELERGRPGRGCGALSFDVLVLHWGRAFRRSKRLHIVEDVKERPAILPLAQQPSAPLTLAGQSGFAGSRSLSHEHMQ